MKAWFFRVVAPSWAALYLVIYKPLGASIYVGLLVLYGIWLGSFIMILLYWVWGVVFYLILLQSNLFDRFMIGLEHILEKRKGKLFVWLKTKLFNDEDEATISSLLILTMFIAESPFTGVPLVRLAYGEDKMKMAILLITIGSILEVITWFVPVYGLGFSTIKVAFALILK